ncbi:MAG: DUF3604 domain-containing protein [Armatimonadota bacterium]
MAQERQPLPEVVERLIDPEVASLRVVTDSTAAVGQPVRVTVQARNDVGATATNGSGAVRIIAVATDDPVELGEVDVDEGLAHGSFEFPDAGVYRIEAYLGDDLRAVSDPLEVAVEAPARSLYWGDIHSHIRERRAQALISDADLLMGPPTVNDALAWARDVAAIHFASVSDHDVNLTDAEWAETIEVHRRLNEDGRFVTFPGYEWGSSQGLSRNFGHRHVIFRRNRVRGVDPVPLFRSREPGTDSAAGFFHALKSTAPIEDVLSVPHHTARGGGNTWMNWDYTDPELERCCEIVSIWGSSEKMGEPFPIDYLASGGYFGTGEARGHHLQDGLARGHRFGFTGGSESHDGRPSQPLVHGPHVISETDFLAPPGITGVWADSFTRDGIFDALRARRCYATTGARIIVRFGLEETPMGGEVPARNFSEAPEFAAEIIGTAPIASCELVRNNAEIDTVSCDGNTLSTRLSDGEAATPGDFYYLRITQVDGEMAWASPIFIT